MVNQFLNQALHGLMISDGHMGLRSVNSKPYYTQTFGQNGGLFALHIYGLMYHLCSPLGLHMRKVQSGKNSPWYLRWTVTTLTNAIFFEYFNLYYRINEFGEKIKIMPLNIAEILTPTVLAYILMSDGNFHKPKGTIRISLHNFTYTEVVLFQDALLSKLDITSRTEHVRKGQYMLIIKKSEVSKVQAMVKEFVIPSLRYRIGM